MANTVFGTDKKDVLIGTNDDDYIDGMKGNDTIRGRGGDDMLVDGPGDDRVFGNAGDDTLNHWIGNDDLKERNTFDLGGGNDSLFVDVFADKPDIGRLLFDAARGVFGFTKTSGQSKIRGIENVEAFCDYDVTAIGTKAANMFRGGWGNDILRGNGGKDDLQGDVGNDRLYGGPGNDYLDGGDGTNKLFGGGGRDDLRQDGVANHVIDGGRGVDQYSARTDGLGVSDVFDVNLATGVAMVTARTPVSGDSARIRNIENVRITGDADVRIVGTNGNNTLTSDAGDDELIGKGGDDKLYSNGGSDTLNGGTGNDELWGDLSIVGAGNDSLDGGKGKDRLVGGHGADTLNGGRGQDTMDAGTDDDRDTFVFTSIDDSKGAEGKADGLSNAEAGEDVFDLAGIDANATTAGDQSFGFAGTTAAAYSVWLVADTGGTWIMADNTGDTASDFTLFCKSGFGYSAADFVL